MSHHRKHSRLSGARAFAVLLPLIGLLAACSSGTSGSPVTTVTKTASASGSSSASTSSTAPAPAAAKTSATAKPTKPVNVQGFPDDGTTVGVGMPIIATFNKKITDARGFAKATTVTVNGHTVHGAWYFEYSDPKSGHVMEAHYRLQNYWPAHAHIHMALALKGVSAGTGLTFDGRLTSLDFSTGPRNIGTVNDVTHTLSIMSDGKSYGTFPTSLGASNTPTARGIKVIMEKGLSICMRGPGYYECHIKYTQRLTYGGEYLHSAPWNVRHIKSGVDSSNGCTNLLPADAEKLYGFLRIGDVVTYPNANGPQMTMGAGYGDWNVTWGQWQTGGAVTTV